MLGSHCDPQLVETQVEFQKALGPNAVVLIYDPLRSMRGDLALKALRLTDDFIAAFDDHRTLFERESVPLVPGLIFEEVAIHVHNTPLASALLTEMRSGLSRHAGRAGEGPEEDEDGGEGDLAELAAVGRAGAGDEPEMDFDRLLLAAHPFLEQSLEQLSEKVPLLADRLREVQPAERESATRRRRREEIMKERNEANKARAREGKQLLPLEDPTKECFHAFPHATRQEKLSTLLLAAQVEACCDDINSFAGENFTKLFLAGSLHK